MLKYAQANISPPPSTLGKAINLTHNQTFLNPNNRTDGSISGGLGWFLYRIELPNDTFLWHNGGTGGFNSELFINKAKKTALVMLVQYGSGCACKRKI
jgi:CubicO group peptidase (beta-lactamase class C family)